MKQFAFALVMVTLAFSTSVQAQEKKLKLEDLKWLTGCWKASKEARNDTFEQWTKPVGGAMLGIGATLGKDGKITSYEYMRIEAQGKSADDVIEAEFPVDQFQYRNRMFVRLKQAFRRQQHPAVAHRAEFELHAGAKIRHR